jgi:hypothetical protein
MQEPGFSDLALALDAGADCEPSNGVDEAPTLLSMEVRADRASERAADARPVKGHFASGAVCQQEAHPLMPLPSMVLTALHHASISFMPFLE